MQIVIGRCPRCGASTESAEGLEGLYCARDHEPAAYEAWGTYYEDTPLSEDTLYEGRDPCSAESRLP
jgi:regulator of RNase E activity RraB